MNVLLTVIVPNYNNGKFIKKCIDSILCYTDEDLELIIVDDGSNDNSKEILDSIRDKRLKIIIQENKGVSAARNVGIGAAMGKYIIFCDSDDFYQNEAIFTLMKYLRTTAINNSLVIFEALKMNCQNGNKKIEDEIFHGISNEIKTRDFFIKLFKNLNQNPVWNKIYITSILKGNKIEFPNSIKRGEDAIFNMEYILFCDSIKTIKKVFYVYCYQISDASSGSSNLSIKMFDEIIKKKILRDKILLKGKNKYSFNRREYKYLCKCQMNYCQRAIYEYTKRLLNKKTYKKKQVHDYLYYHDDLKNVIKSSAFNSNNIKDIIKALAIKCI